MANILTKLEAVNIMLDSIGESRVNTLESGLEDAEEAESILDEIKNDVLEKGWTINTERNHKLARDVDGYVNLPSNWLRVVPSGYSAGINAVPRKSGSFWRLYDKTNQTLVWGTDVYADLVITFEFEELPRAYQKYITALAAETLQQRALGSIVLNEFLDRWKTEGWTAMNDFEADGESSNVLRDSPSVRAGSYRNNKLWGV